MKVKDFLIKNYSLVLNNDRFEGETFYEFVKHRLYKYKKDLNLIDENEFCILLDNYNFKGKKTKLRFINAVSVIIDECIHILQCCYKGDIWRAGELLEDLMLTRHKLNRYLEDYYINCFRHKLLKCDVLFRMRDCKKGEQPKDCWHVPYEKRNITSSSRYSFAGVPALYLADSIDTANKEIGELEECNDRWYSEFILNNKLFMLDLTIPSKDTTDIADKTETIDYLLTFPIRLLCSIQTVSSGACEEYYFPQLFCHWLSKENKDISIKFYGIVYSSTIHLGGVNYVFPAFYSSKEPIKGHSPILLELFEATSPKLYNP